MAATKTKKMKKPSEPARNMGLGKLKGSMDGKTRKSRLDAAIDADTGYTDSKKKKK